MLTLSEKQLKELDELLDKFPHAYAKAIILLVQKFNLENRQAAEAAIAAKEEVLVEAE